MVLSENGVRFIEGNEGFVPHVYSDNGVPTIAYGHRLRPGESFPNGVTEPEGDMIFRKDVSEDFEPIVNARIPATCTQCEFDVLVDFTYNVENQPASLAQLLAHGWSNVPTQLLRWCHELVNGVWIENPELLARRQKEVNLWTNGVYE